MKKSLIKLILPTLIIGSSMLPMATSFVSCGYNKHLRLIRNDWHEQTKNNLNKVIDTYGIDGKKYSKDNYVVFDFDETTAIFDIQHACTAYQIETMAYNLTKDELKDVLLAELKDTEKKLLGYDFTYSDLINDITTCYGNLANKYGPFTSKGVDDSKLSSLHDENDWKDFSSKLRFLFSIISKKEGSDIAGKWSTYHFTGMTPDEVYDLEKRCLLNKQKIKSKYEIWESVTNITNSNTKAKYKFIQGVSVTENIKELYKTIHDNGINIWIVSASQIDQVRAAADTFGIGQYVTGALALTNKVGDKGKYIHEYDKNGKGYIKKDGNWVKMEKHNTNIPRGEGKSLTIKDVIAPNYNNHGPIMCFGDSSGDFNFCTEFKDTKLVVCFNRADRSINEGGGLMAILAIYQKLNNITLEQANENNDTLYCLQGRNENTREFINSNETIKVDYSEQQLFLNANNYALLSYMLINKLSIENACKLSIKQNVIGLDVGFLDQYIGYHKR